MAGSRAFRVGLVVGGAIMAFGVAGFVRHAEETVPASSLAFLLGALIAHDAVWAWLVAAVSVVLVRVVPRRVRPVVMGALAVSAVLVVVAVPVLTGEGRLANNPSILPRDYGHGLLAALGCVWGVAAVVAVVRLRRPLTAMDVVRPRYERDVRGGW